MKGINIPLRIFMLAVVLLSARCAFSQDPNFYIFLCFGQSNMVGGGNIGPEDQTVDSRFGIFQAVNCSNLGKTKENWYTANPPLCRCYTGLSLVDYFGRNMVANLPSNVRVGVIIVAVEGCSIELFDKYNYRSSLDGAADWLKNIVNNDYGGNPYQYLINLARLAKNEGVIKGILLHQGESNYGDTQWPSKVRTIYNYMMSDLGLNPSSVPLLAGQLAGGNSSGMNSNIIATLPQVLPNSHIIPSNDCALESDGIHFNLAGKREFGKRYATTMLSLLGSCSPSTITPYVQVNGGAWQQTGSVTVASGATVVLGPQPVSGGSWSWSGCGASGSSREQTITLTSSCTATATYTNGCGATSTQSFAITVNGGGATYVTIANRTTGLLIDGMGRTSNGSICGQWNSSGSSNQQWTLETAGSYVKIKNRATGLYLDGMGYTTNGLTANQYSSSTSNNQQWTQETAGSYIKFRNRATGLYLDGMGRTSNGSDLGQWSSSSDNNQQWTVSTLKSAIAPDAVASVKESLAGSIASPNPVIGVLKLQLSAPVKEIAVYSIEGKQLYKLNTTSKNVEIDMSGFKSGVYVLKAVSQNETWTQKVLKR
jgi:hypothetical protein